MSHDPKKTLAEGEVTGHAHVLEKTEVQDTDDGTKVFEVTGHDTLVHEEHGAIDLTAGKWESGIVLEQDHFSEESRKVAD